MWTVAFLSLAVAHAFTVASARECCPLHPPTPAPPDHSHQKHPIEELRSKGFGAPSSEASLVFIIFLDLPEQTML